MFGLLTTWLTLLSTVIEALQVIGGNTTVVQGGTAILPCKLIDATEPLTQISWRKKPETDNFFAILPDIGPKFVNGYDARIEFVGNFIDNNGSLQLSNATLMDDGTYECLFTLFPSGIVKTDVLLNLLVPPVTSVKDDRPTLGNEEVSLVSCVAAGSKPPAEVKWDPDNLAGKVKVTTNSTRHVNGTTTTVTSLVGVPTKEINRHVVHCVVNSAAMLKEERLPFTIQVYFPPADVNIRKISEHSFECETEANPAADFTWSKSDQSWPKSGVSADGAKLHFLDMTSHVNGLYQCEASNLYGSKRGNIYVYVTPESSRVCWILFSILLILVAFGVGAAVWYLRKSGRFPSIGEVTRGLRQKVPSSPSSRAEAENVKVEEEQL